VVALLARYGVTVSCMDARIHRRATVTEGTGTDTNERLVPGRPVVALVVSDYRHQRQGRTAMRFLSRLRSHLVSGVHGTYVGCSGSSELAGVAPRQRSGQDASTSKRMCLKPSSELSSSDLGFDTARVVGQRDGATH
jgi:hypothetical protein